MINANNDMTTIYVKNEVYRKELFFIWCRMKNYVKFINNKVKICKEWEDFDIFYRWAIFTGFNKEVAFYLPIRKDPKGDFCPNNCAWKPFTL